MSRLEELMWRMCFSDQVSDADWDEFVALAGDRFDELCDEIDRKTREYNQLGTRARSSLCREVLGIPSRDIYPDETGAFALGSLVGDIDGVRTSLKSPVKSLVGVAVVDDLGGWGTSAEVRRYLTRKMRELGVPEEEL